MARQDSTRRSGAGRHRWPGVSDARSRLCLVRSGSGDRGRQSPYRPQPATLFDGIGLKLPAMPEPKPAQPSSMSSSRQVMSDCPECNADLAVLRIPSDFGSDCALKFFELTDEPRGFSEERACVMTGFPYELARPLSVSDVKRNRSREILLRNWFRQATLKDKISR